jgi:hypothetical protein
VHTKAFQQGNCATIPFLLGIITTFSNWQSGHLNHLFNFTPSTTALSRYYQRVYCSECSYILAAVLTGVIGEQTCENTYLTGRLGSGSRRRWLYPKRNVILERSYPEWVRRICVWVSGSFKSLGIIWIGSKRFRNVSARFRINPTRIYEYLGLEELENWELKRYCARGVSRERYWQ